MNLRKCTECTWIHFVAVASGNDSLESLIDRSGKAEALPYRYRQENGCAGKRKEPTRTRTRARNRRPLRGRGEAGAERRPTSSSAIPRDRLCDVLRQYGRLRD